MSKVGEMLRDARESQNLTFDDIEQSTSIRTSYLQAIESGDYSALPGDVYTKGFIRNYANVLGLNGAEFVDSYNREKKGLAPLSSTSNKKETDELNDFEKYEQSRSSMSLSSDQTSNSSFDSPFKAADSPVDFNLTPTHTMGIIGLFLLVIAICVYFAFASVSNKNEQITEKKTTEENIEKIEKSKKDANKKRNYTFDLVREGNNIKIVPTNNSKINSINLELIMKNDCWGRIVADGEELYSGTLNKGAEIEWHANETIMFEIDDANAVDILINGKKLEKVNSAGERLERIITLDKKRGVTTSLSKKAPVRLIEEKGKIVIVPITNVAVDEIEAEAEATEDCWASITADGKEIFEGTIEKGQKLSWSAKEKLTVNFGNASAIKLVINGKALDKLGDDGEITEKTITIQEKKSTLPKGNSRLPTKTDAQSKKIPSKIFSDATDIVVVPAGDESIEGIYVDVDLDADSWASITADGKTVFEGVLQRGKKLSWKASTKMNVRFGNAGAVKMIVNGNEMDKLGSYSDIYERDITIEN